MIWFRIDTALDIKLVMVGHRAQRLPGLQSIHHVVMVHMIFLGMEEKLCQGSADFVTPYPILPFFQVLPRLGGGTFS